MSLLLALGIVAILILSGFLWGSIEIKETISLSQKIL